MPTSHQKLRKGASNVVYEIQMMRDTCDMLIAVLIGRLTIKEPKLEMVSKNALLESLLLHVRNLYEFFYDFRRDKRDFHYSDYLTSSSRRFRSNRATATIIKPFLFRIDRRLAHISQKRNYYRVRYKDWPFRKMRYQLETTFDAFKNSLPRKRKNWFETF